MSIVSYKSKVYTLTLCLLFITSIFAGNATNNFISDNSYDLPQSNNTQANASLGKAQVAFEQLEKSGNYTDRLDANKMEELPLGILTEGNVQYAIVVTKAQFTPEYATIDVFAKITTPQKGEKGKKELYFGAEGIKLSYTGGIIGNTKLVLLGNVEIPINNDMFLTLEGGEIQKSNGGGLTNTYTYANIDCNGIKELSLRGNLQISRNLLLPIDLQSGKIDTKETITKNGKIVPNRVRGEFSVIASDWNDLLLDIDLTPFAITAQTKNADRGYFGFVANNIILDLSDTRNDPSIKFPQKYSDNGYLIAGTESWRGLYIKEFAVNLPEEFKSSKDPKKPVSFRAQDLIIDEYGVSGVFSAQNIISNNDGTTSEKNGWKYSLDNLGIELAASKIVGGNLSGTIQLPINKNDGTKNGFGFKGMITEDDYLLSVSLNDKINFDLWSAKATLSSGSTIELRVKNHQFLPKAILNGEMEITANSDNKNNDSDRKDLSFKGIKFQQLTIQSVEPYLSVAYLGAEGEQHLANLPISISNPSLSTNGKNIDLGFGITVGLQDKGFSASGNVHIQSEIASNNNTLEWKYKGFRVSKLILDNIDIKVANISGELELMKDDPVYGQGLKGKLNADITGGIKVGVNAYFGFSSFRYWGFEGSVKELNIPTPTGLNIKGFIGGAFYHMSPISGTGQSALIYTPNEKIGLFLRAGIYGGLKKDGVADIMSSFNISTNSNGGIANIGFMGEAHVMAKLSSLYDNPFDALKDKFKGIIDNNNTIKQLYEKDKLKSVLDTKDVDQNYPTDGMKKSAIDGYLAMNYDFNNKTFHANIDVYVNVAGGIIKGVGNGGRAGYAVIHIAPNEWYLHIGRPDDMIGLKVGVGSFSIESKSYFMVGTNIPNSPAPPSEVARILKKDLTDLDYMKNLNELGNGAGFAFGSHFKYSTGDITALMLYANFQAGIGGDIMLKNYGEATCSNRGGDKIGINGWYANGQAYAYLEGELGIKIKLFMIKKKIPIIKAGAAALLQIKAPNPFWMRGYLGGNYSLLGGLVKGSFRFKLEFGEECQLAQKEQVMGGLKIIADLTPTNKEQDVNVFAIPQATFSMKVNEPIEVEEDNGKHVYKIVIEKMTIIDDQGKEIPGRIEYGYGSSNANFISNEILPPRKSMKAIVEVSFMEKKNGVFDVVTIDGQKAIEREERTFTTGSAPNTIPLSNIQYAYPVINQQNLYTKESSQGYIKLKRGQNYLFDDGSWTTETNFKSSNGTIVPTTFKYNESDNTLSFTIPDLEKANKYTFAIMAKTKTGENTANNTQTVNQETSLGDDDENITMNTETQKAQNITKNGNIERLKYDFRTSKFPTLANKIDAANTTTRKGRISSDLVYLLNESITDEAFDITELLGTEYTDNKPLIKAEALMDDVFASKFKQLFYNSYPLNGITLTRTDNTSIPPINALPLTTPYTTYLTEQPNNPKLRTTFPYMYDLFRIYNADWYEMLTKAITLKITTKQIDVNLQAIIDSNFGVIPDGKYNINLKYILPNGKACSENNVVYNMTSRTITN